MEHANLIEFVELRSLPRADRIPPADSYLQLFERQVCTSPQLTIVKELRVHNRK